MPDKPHHGGRLNEAARRWGIPRSDWLDLSTGINPQGWPVPDLPADIWQRLPESDDGLEQAVCHWAGAGESARCVAVPGSQAAIMALPGLRSVCRVGVPQPGYREHGYWWARAGHQVVPLNPQHMAGDDERWLDELDVVVWINPNNPDGRVIPADRLARWCQRLQQRGGWLLVDQAFADGYDNISLAPYTGMPGLVVMRSLGKFFGLAGVRAGAVLTEVPVAAALEDALGPWPLSGPARYVMAAALADVPWQAATTQRLQRDSRRLHELLAGHGLPGSQGTLLFRYLAHPRALAITESLASRGILVRSFDALHAPDSLPALRLGLPGHEDEWQTLARGLAALANVIDQ